MTEYELLWSYGHEAVEDYLLVVEKELATMYRGIYRDTVAKLSDFYARFGDLESANKYNRLGNLKSAIADEYRKLTGKSIELTGDTSTASVTGAYESTWFNIETLTKEALEFGILPADAIRASVLSEYSGASFVTRFGVLHRTTVDKVAQAITRGLASGTGYKKTAQEVKDIFGISYKDTLRIIQTESTRCFAEGFNSSTERAIELGVEGADTWLATFAPTTRDRHAQLNGEKKGKDGYYHNGGQKAKGPGLWGDASMDINCKCAQYFQLDDVKGLPDWKYSQWKEAFDEWKALPPKQRSVKLKVK